MNSSVRKLTLEELKTFVRKEVKRAEGSVDDLYGKYLFAPNRNDVPRPPEENTEKEKDLWNQLEKHYRYAKSDFSNIVPTLLGLVRQGKYKEFLEPPAKPAYRFLNNLTLDEASTLLGISAEDIKKRPNEAWYLSNGGVLSPQLTKTQSWTTKLHFSWAIGLFENIRNEHVSVLLVADPRDPANQFIINPDTTLNKISNLPGPAYREYETVSYGSVNFHAAAYIYCDAVDLKQRIEKLGPAPEGVQNYTNPNWLKWYNKKLQTSIEHYGDYNISAPVAFKKLLKAVGVKHRKPATAKAANKSTKVVFSTPRNTTIHKPTLEELKSIVREEFEANKNDPYAWASAPLPAHLDKNPKGTPEEPFGKYLFAPERTDVPKPPELNTREEDALWAHLRSHYGSGDRTIGDDIPKLLNLIKQGKYTDLLQPPKTPVYRFLNNLTVEEASALLGIPEEDIKKRPNQAWYNSDRGVLSPKRGEVQSWTTKLHSSWALQLFAGVQPYNISVVLVANPRDPSNQFIINPNAMLNKVKGLPGVAYREFETLSYGDVRFYGAAYIYNDEEDLKRQIKTLGDGPPGSNVDPKYLAWLKKRQQIAVGYPRSLIPAPVALKKLIKALGLKIRKPALPAAAKQTSSEHQSLTAALKDTP